MSWVGGLPPLALERVRRQRESSVAGSFLSAPAAMSLASVGWQPAGEVMGCIVMNLGFGGFGCTGGQYGSYGQFNNYGPTPVISSGDPGRTIWAGYRPYIDALYRGYGTALRRMLAEAGALGAAGVVGVDLRCEHLDSGIREFIALGTAVRSTAPGAPGPAQPFCTDLSGEDVAKAALAGWSPLGIAIGLAVSVKHEDQLMQSQTSRLMGAGNVEVAGLTELLHTCRSDARHQFEGRAKNFPGGEQAIGSRITLHTSEGACGGGGHDYRAECQMFGSVLQRGEAPPPKDQPTLRVMPLRGSVSK